MLEKVGDIFSQPDANAICFTSNGIVDSRGNLVMGAGIALAFKNKYPFLPKHMGTMVKKHGNHVHSQATSLYPPYLYLVSFPTKNHWKDPSDINLIEQSAKELVVIATNFDWKRCYLTRPGCGLGGLNWDDVKKVIEPILDNRFTVLVPK